MTNHPRRKRDDETAEPAGEEPAAHLEPAEPGAIPLQGSAEVPAHTGNGLPPGLKPNTAKVAAEAVAEALGQHLPQMLFQAVAAALQQVPVQTVTQQHMCATCIINRITWENAHRSAMEAAMAAAAQAAGVEADSPQARRTDLTPFLPAHLRPGETAGIPNIAQAVTAVQGTEMCPVHAAESAGIRAGRSPLLVATATMNPAMLGQFAGTG